MRKEVRREKLESRAVEEEGLGDKSAWFRYAL
jgi:hypothetical protein